MWSTQEVGQQEKSIIEDGFEAFKNHDYPVPPSPEEGCLVITIDLNTETSYWNMEHCYTAFHFPVCKARKLCL
jgi:hypothetical protein